MKIFDFAVYIINRHSLCQENRVKEKMMNMELRNALNMGGEVQRQKEHRGENPSTKQAV